MKISTKGRYALRTMIDLAMNNTGENISIKAIAERQGISTKYLSKLFQSLTRQAMLKAKGAQTAAIALPKSLRNTPLA